MAKKKEKFVVRSTVPMYLREIPFEHLYGVKGSKVVWTAKPEEATVYNKDEAIGRAKCICPTVSVSIDKVKDKE